MAQIIRISEHIISNPEVAWSIRVRDGEKNSVSITYHESSNCLHYIIGCEDFDQITPLKTAAENYFKSHNKEVLKGEMITIRPILKTRKEG